MSIIVLKYPGTNETPDVTTFPKKQKPMTMKAVILGVLSVENIFFPGMTPASAMKKIMGLKPLLFKLPVDQRVYIPFFGAGSELIGFKAAGYSDIYGCEIDPDYIQIAEARIKYWTKNGFYFKEQDNWEQSRIKEKREKERTFKRLF